MKIILLICLFTLLNTQENQDSIQKALLIKTNLTKEELTTLLEANSQSNNTSVEEVEPESELGNEKILKSLKDGKLKIKIKLEFDFNKIEEKQTESETEAEAENENSQPEESQVQVAYLQTNFQEMPQKISLFKYILGLLIAVIIMSLYVISSHSKRYKKNIYHKYTKKDDYLLKDN